MNTKREMNKSTKLALIVSGAVLVIGIVLVVLLNTQTIAPTESAKLALALAITVAMIVFAYTLCKHRGVLKNQRK